LEGYCHGLQGQGKGRDGCLTTYLTSWSATVFLCVAWSRPCSVFLVALLQTQNVFLALLFHQCSPNLLRYITVRKFRLVVTTESDPLTEPLSHTLYRSLFRPLSSSLSVSLTSVLVCSLCRCLYPMSLSGSIILVVSVSLSGGRR
jgi:hypothetical protein